MFDDLVRAWGWDGVGAVLMMQSRMTECYAIGQIIRDMYVTSQRLHFYYPCYLQCIRHSITPIRSRSSAVTGGHTLNNGSRKVVDAT